MGYLEGLESLPGVGLVALMHQLSHLLGAACFALLIHRIDPAWPARYFFYLLLALCTKGITNAE